MTQEIKKRDYISFSEIHLFSQCPYKHWLNYVLGERDKSSIYTTFGSAIHEALELSWKENLSSSWIRMGKIILLFCRYHNLTESNPNKLLDSAIWFKSAKRIYDHFWQWLNCNFPGCEVYDIELCLEESIEGYDRKFLGFIDLILYNKEKDEYHIIDLKTTKVGWFKKQLSDTHKLYQVILYKKFFCEKLNINPKKVHCHYLLMLREPPKKLLDEPFKLHSVTSGEKKIQNADTWMKDCIRKIEKGIKIKNPTQCSFCQCGAKK